MERAVLAYVDLEGRPTPGGTPMGARGGNESALFEYDKSWLENSLRFSLEPALQLGPGPYHTANDVPMFGAIGDSVPDRWGRALELDYLLLADDQTRGTSSNKNLQQLPNSRNSDNTRAVKREAHRTVGKSLREKPTSNYLSILLATWSWR